MIVTNANEAIKAILYQLCGDPPWILTYENVNDLQALAFSQQGLIKFTLLDYVTKIKASGRIKVCASDEELFAKEDEDAPSE